MPKSIDHDHVCDFLFDELDPKNEEHLAKLYIICKEGLAKAAREEYHEKILTVNKFLLGALVLGDEVVSMIRRELRKLSAGVYVSTEEILRVLSDEVLKREVLEGEEAEKAQSQVKRSSAKVAKRTKDSSTDTPESESEEPMESGDQQDGSVKALDDSKADGG